MFSLTLIQPNLWIPETSATQTLKSSTLSPIIDSRPKRDEQRNIRLSGFVFFQKEINFRYGLEQYIRFGGEKKKSIFFWQVFRW
ncbi:hypothetical protein Bca4012_020325 [Brassica carinata]|uniref:Uncharacterized protein n=1 Tax=Brassica carinata TaxID=52824 RepID=A0A8X7WII3_BRACI|nr:hypothetical protein Bca52824_001296 [Brassica carinata]